MSVVFTTIDSITIDGIPAGNIVDVVSNHAPKRAEVLAAYRVFADAEKAKRDEAVVKLEADKSKLTTDLATATTQLEAATQAKTTLEGQVATMTDQLNLANNTLESVEKTAMELGAKVLELEAKVGELTPPPKPESVTPAQIRIWLLSNGIALETVAGMIAAIPDETIRKIAQVRWEYGLVVLRDDPLVQQMGAALGFTTEQMDAAFLAASQIT
jgi:hypothetical protein